ncbi:Bifunctional inhibitor/lipid-transfer protein/seed storage 2S albumin superfamily protein [Euphorbia peplus]|nr:Bifunctional inhibitor/lipid-transfer protein/seed storage 2S albumin superfamily protein [Euphorbia peplus]
MAIEALTNEETPAPTPGSVDCSTVIYDMVDCLPYLTEDSNTVDSSCCSGLESVLSVDSSCLCFGLKESVDFGITLNFTRAVNLPSDCNLSVSPSVTQCSVSSPSSPSPSPSPSSPPSHSHLSPKTSPSSSPKAPSSSKPPVSAPKSSSPGSASPSPTSSASPKQAPIIASETPAPAPTKSGASYISTISILNLVLIIISMINVASLV